MKRYLGSAMTVFSAVVIPVMMCYSICFAVIVLLSEFSIATLFISIMCISCCFLSGVVLYRNRRDLYSWGVFKDDGVLIYSLFQGKSLLRYDQCKSVGIGLYRHAFLNSSNSMFGSNVVFIFITDDVFDEKYRTCINRWHMNSTSIKVRFDFGLYSFLITKLPKKKAEALIRDYSFYSRYLGNKA